MSIHTAASLTLDDSEAQHQADLLSRKRKRDDIELCDIDRRPFTVHPTRDDPFAAPKTFTPICLLSRAQLPLAYIDAAGSGSQLFAADLKILEACHGYEEDASILVAEEARHQRLYAIERTAERIYALCRLGQWVTKAGLVSASKIVLKPGVALVKRPLLNSGTDSPSWWCAAAVDHPPLPLPGTAQNRPRNLLSLVEVTNAPPAVSNEATSRRPSLDHAPRSIPPGPAQSEPLPSESANQQDVLEELSKQYLEALYLARTSLAYFTKAPLSRARAAFNGNPGTEYHISHLCEFLLEATLSATVMDKKYRESVASVIAESPMLPSEQAETRTKPRKKKKFKAKRDKAGMFNNEKEYVLQWWQTTEDESMGLSPETREAAVRRRVPFLRSRETYLQIILILEVMALEATMKVEKAQGSAQLRAETHVFDSQEHQTETSSDTKKKKKSKRSEEDLTALLEILLDRLCIWYSVDSHSPAKRPTGEGVDATEEHSDELKSFCFEVIVPFYTTRLPKQAALVNKKLGGPSPPTPLKHTTVRRPGEPAVRQPLEKQIRKPLERVPTETINQSIKRVPVLHRAATDSNIIPQIKRESTDRVPLHSIPAVRPGAPQPRKRNSLAPSLSFREIDLTAMAQANEAKMRKKAETEEKLRDAIATLKKPNRGMAVRELAENADASFANATTKPKPGSHVRKDRPRQVTSSVHVAATPKARRVVEATPMKGMAPIQGYHSQLPALIPSSSSRLFLPPDMGNDRTAFEVPQTGHRPRHFGGIDETPLISRRSNHIPALEESPVAQRRRPLQQEQGQRTRTIQQTPVKPTKHISLAETPMPDQAKHLWPSSTMKDTNSKLPVPTSANAARTDSGIAMSKPAEGKKSIYDSLGWDDEYDDESLA